MAKEHGKSGGRNQPKNQTNNLNRQKSRQAPNRKSSGDLKVRRPGQRVSTNTNMPAKGQRQLERHDEATLNTSVLQTSTVPKPTYERELNIKIPAGLMSSTKKSASIELPDLKALRRERAERVMQAMKSLEEVLDLFEYPEGCLPESTIKSLVMEIEAFQKK